MRELARALVMTSAAQFCRPHHHARVHRALSHAYSPTTRRPTLKELSRVAAIAPHHFHRVFRACMGETVQTHLRRVQLERAAFELFVSNRSVSEIATRAGYVSAAAFSRAFYRMHGKSARTFRRDRPTSNYIQAIAPDLRAHFTALPVEFRTQPDKHLKCVRRGGPLLQAIHDGRETVERRLQNARKLGNAAIFKRTPDFPPITSPDQLRLDSAVLAEHEVPGSGDWFEDTIEGGPYASFRLEGLIEDEEMVLQLWNYVYLVWAPDRKVQIQPFGSYEVRNRKEGRTTSVEVHVQVQADWRFRTHRAE